MRTWDRVAAAAIGWFVIGLPYYLTVGKADGDFVLAATRLLSFFTILTNILVALAMTLPWLAPESKLGAFFSRPSYDVAPALYIVDWLVFVPKGTLSARSVPWWLLYPGVTPRFRCCTAR